MASSPVTVAPMLPGERMDEACIAIEPPAHRSSHQTAELHSERPLASKVSPANEADKKDIQLEDLSDTVLSWFKKRNGDTLNCALAFVPWVLQQAHSCGDLQEGSVILHSGSGAVVFSDASGFTALTERLAKKSNGAELLSQCLTAFFTPLIDLINAYRGDTIKFSGDALTIYFQAVDDTKGDLYNGVVPPHGTYGLEDLGPMATAVLRASACCIEIHKRLHMFDTGVDGVRLCLHIGVGCGEVSILQVGGVVPPETHVPRYEYLIAGPPLEQISIAEPLAKNGETCLSPQAWDHVKDCVIEGPPLDRPEFHLLLRMDESKYTFPTIKHAARENDSRSDHRFKISELNIMRRYIPSAVFKQIECGTLAYVNEMRNVSVIFISGSGLDVTSESGAQKCQELVSSIQRACYAHEGTLNKFLIDDKGMLFLLVFGLPPVVHTDDPTRAVLCCFDMVKVFRRLGLLGRFGVTTGRSYCGLCGSAARMEYTVLGDCVNLSARLMANAPPHGVLCDQETMSRGTSEVIFNPLTPITVKGKANPIPIYQPAPRDMAAEIGLTCERKIWFPWFDNPMGGALTHSSSGAATMMKNAQQLCGVKEWAGIQKVQDMLGGHFSGDLHQNDQTISTTAPTVRAPPGSPFAEGGVVVLEGTTGMGKIELAQHAVMYAAVRFSMMPVFGTMGPRPGDSIRLAVELLRSTLGVFRLLNAQVPLDDYQALMQVVPAQFASRLPILRSAILGDRDRQIDGTKERAQEVLDTGLEVVIGLLNLLTKQVPVMLVLQYEYGMSLFPNCSEDQKIFWRAAAKLGVLCSKESNHSGPGVKPLVMMILAREAEMSNPLVRQAVQANTLVSCTALTDDNLVEYMAAYLNVQEHMVSPQLKKFVSKVTLGNPLYVRETLDQLQESQNVVVCRSPGFQPRALQCQDLDKINISAWHHTAMVGGTVCLLESLDPLEAMVLKMSTCFQGPFTLPDVAASTCSKWADATNFDNLRLFNAIRKLVEMNIIERVAGVGNGMIGTLEDNTRFSRVESGGSRVWGSEPARHFQMRNVLIRAVGGAMVLEAQKKSVKRQALVDRALQRELPGRLQVLASERSRIHIPWYYEQAFRRMELCKVYG